LARGSDAFEDTRNAMADMPYREEKAGSVINANADYTDLTDIVEPSLGGFLHTQVEKNVPRMKIVLDLRVSLDINGAGESEGSPMRNNHAENREAFSCPIFGHCFCPALRGDSLPFRRLGGEYTGDP
jgi:hypothetical protein